MCFGFMQVGWPQVRSTVERTSFTLTACGFGRRIFQVGFGSRISTFQRSETTIFPEGGTVPSSSQDMYP